MLVRRRQFDAELQEEMRLHRELREQEQIERGLSPMEAHYQPWDWNLGVFGLLKPGVSRAGAEAELTALCAARMLHPCSPGNEGRSHGGVAV
jgi:hypothetical protein